MKDVLRFIPAYLNLLIGVAVGYHQTLHPIGPMWRWRHWHKNR